MEIYYTIFGIKIPEWLWDFATIVIISTFSAVIAFLLVNSVWSLLF